MKRFHNTGLTIKGGSGPDNIENDAQNGVVIDGNDARDWVYLGEPTQVPP